MIDLKILYRRTVTNRRGGVYVECDKKTADDLFQILVNENGQNVRVDVFEISHSKDRDKSKTTIDYNQIDHFFRQEF